MTLSKFDIDVKSIADPFDSTAITSVAGKSARSEVVLSVAFIVSMATGQSSHIFTLPVLWYRVRRMASDRVTSILKRSLYCASCGLRENNF